MPTYAPGAVGPGPAAGTRPRRLSLPARGPCTAALPDGVDGRRRPRVPARTDATVSPLRVKTWTHPASRLWRAACPRGCRRSHGRTDPADHGPAPELPPHRQAHTLDLTVDLVIDPDLTAWQWKDEDEYTYVRRLGIGIATDIEHQAVDRVHTQVLVILKERAGPGRSRTSAGGWLDAGSLPGPHRPQHPRRRSRTSRPYPRRFARSADPAQRDTASPWPCSTGPGPRRPLLRNLRTGPGSSRRRSTPHRPLLRRPHLHRHHHRPRRS